MKTDQRRAILLGQFAGNRLPFKLMKIQKSCALLCALFLILGLLAAQPAYSQAAPPNPEPDSRYKVDILLIVGHPDDDVIVTAYLAKVIEQDHKSVAVVYTTRGNSGGNAAGQEQANALADIREMEARHSLASYGIDLAWFLHGSDTPGADVLHSLERWGHGKMLDEIVRLVRITRPEVVFTFLPNYTVGENHEDHQAAGVLATEAFDLAGNPLAFPEQVEAPRSRLNINNYGEGLRPWQPKKIYYFSDATNLDFEKGKGPEYPTNGVSPSRKVPYSRIAAEAWGYYKTQNTDFSDAELKKFTENPVRVVFGKSLVGGSETGDVFEGVSPGPISYAKPRGYQSPEKKLALELGGPWAFYHAFWPAHNVGHLAELLSPEAQVAPGDMLWVPLIIRNDTDSNQEVRLSALLPEGWKQQPDSVLYKVSAHDGYPIQLALTAPESQKGTWQTLTWHAVAGGNQIGPVSLRVEVVGNYLPQ
jgi:LmbE family N-acetylglucosaminyl deacetylase